jgi:DNA polymerase-3 subunit gamma/tau
MAVVAVGVTPALAQDAGGSRQFGQPASERQFSDSLKPVAVPPAKPQAAHAKKTVKPFKVAAARPAHVHVKHAAPPVSTEAQSPPAVTAETPVAATPSETTPATTAPVATAAPAPVAPAPSPAPQVQQGVPVIVYGIGALIIAMLAGVAALLWPRRRARAKPKAVAHDFAPPPPSVEPSPEPLVVEPVATEPAPEPLMTESVAAPAVAAAKPPAPNKAPVQKRKTAAAPKSAPAPQTPAPVAKAASPAKKTVARPKAAVRPAANDDVSAPVGKPVRRRKTATSGASGK